jgi:hypothetical protein
MFEFEFPTGTAEEIDTFAVPKKGSRGCIDRDTFTVPVCRQVEPAASTACWVSRRLTFRQGREGRGFLCYRLVALGGNTPSDHSSSPEEECEMANINGKYQPVWMLLCATWA